MNKNEKKIEEKIRVSEAVQQACSNHISEWEGGRIDIINKFIRYLEEVERINETNLKEGLAEIEIDTQHRKMIEEVISISMTIQQQKEIERAARRYNKEVSQFIRQPFYLFERHKKFPWK